MHLKEILMTRGYLKQHTHDDVFDLYEKWGQTLYVGMDPTADSLHFWNFVWFMHALQYMKKGNKLIFIVWWATGMIGDPGGKDAERVFLDEATLAHNVQKIYTQVESVLANIAQISWETFDFEVINNLDFYKDMWYLKFLREVGKYITVNNMMKKETVKRRLETDDQSISYTEFSYMLIQGYDFVRLYQDHGCRLQVAWSDQRGNVVTGIELINKIVNDDDSKAYGVTTPLILDNTGKKFGKSEWNAIRLDPKKNHPYVCYNYFINTADEDISRYFKLFTIQTLDQIQEIVTQHNADPSVRYGQQQLAYYVVQMIYGSIYADQCVHIQNILYMSQNPVVELETCDDTMLISLHQALWWAISTETDLKIIDALVLSGLYTSNGEAKKAIKNNAISLSGRKIQDIWYICSWGDWIQWKILLLKKGKKTYGSVMKE